MGDEMKFQKEYQDTFNEVKAPEKLAQKMLELPKTDCKKTKVSFAKKLAAAAAILFSVFVAGNGVAYAATGVSLLTRAKICVNGVFYEAQIEEVADENGDTWYNLTVGKGGLKQVGAADASFLEEFPYQFVTYHEVEDVEIVEDENHVYLVDGEIRIDITNDVAKGSATGTYEKDGRTHDYKITEVIEGIWDVNVSNKSSFRTIVRQMPLIK